ncbi:hypothetical protein [Clostridium sp.]|uniref:hypothetical protein n=1 Tax=Clostridium sp. TaxID=1506 RepID=UPI0025C461EA|nr:hypothetical protein [Clostridium sp.]
MRLDLNKISYDVKVDSNVNITLSEIAFNKEKQEEYICNPKYFTNFSSMFNYMLTKGVKSKLSSCEKGSIEDIKEELDTIKKDIIELVKEFKMDELIKETIDSINDNKEKMKKKANKKKEDE